MDNTLCFTLKFEDAHKNVDEACEFALKIWAECCELNEDEIEWSQYGNNQIKICEAIDYIYNLAGGDYDDTDAIMFVLKNLAAKIVKKYPDLEFSIDGNITFEDCNQDPNDPQVWYDEFLIKYNDKKLTWQMTEPYIGLPNSYYDGFVRNFGAEYEGRWLSEEEIDEIIEYAYDGEEFYICGQIYDKKGMIIYGCIPPLSEPKEFEIDWDNKD